MRRKKGFTLIELMVVIIIVGILAAVAIPIMRGNIEKAQGTEGVAQLGAIRSAQRVYYAEHDHYAGTLANLGFETGDLVGKYYNGDAATVTNATATTFTANIAGIGDASGESVKIDQAGTITDTF